MGQPHVVWISTDMPEAPHLQQPVTEAFEGKTVWEGVVHIFDLSGNPKASRAYAWSSPIEGSDKRRFFAVLHLPPVTSPAEAVRAAIVAEARERT